MESANSTADETRVELLAQFESWYALTIVTHPNPNPINPSPSPNPNAGHTSHTTGTKFGGM